MSSFSDYLENKLLEHIFTSAWTRVATGYIALFTAAPSDSGGGTEVSGNGYARVAVGMDASSWTVTGNAATNDGRIEFPQATPSGWGTITHFAIFDASSGGNMLMWAPLASSKTINAGDIPIFQAGEIDVTLT